jgi:broad specificity phosphatase PhoE
MQEENNAAASALQIEGRKLTKKTSLKYVAIRVGTAIIVVGGIIVLLLYLFLPYLFWPSGISVKEYEKHPYGDLLLVRHAYAPGNGDPRGFSINNCSTQRNLNSDGRAQARLIGTRLGNLAGEAVVFNPRIWTSQWCRCKDTAAIMAATLNESTNALSSMQKLVQSSNIFESVPANIDYFYVEEEWGLNSFYQNWGLGYTKDIMISRLKTAVVAKSKVDAINQKTSNSKAKLHTILVTHSVTVTALTGLRVASGGIVAYDSTGHMEPVELLLDET